MKWFNCYPTILSPTLKITRKSPRSANLGWFCGWLLCSQNSSLVSVIFNDWLFFPYLVKCDMKIFQESFQEICCIFHEIFTLCSTSPRTNRLMFLWADIVKNVTKNTNHSILIFRFSKRIWTSKCEGGVFLRSPLLTGRHPRDLDRSQFKDFSEYL